MSSEPQVYYTECYIDTISNESGRLIKVTITPASDYRIDFGKSDFKPSVLFVMNNSVPKQCLLKPIEELEITIDRIWMKRLILQCKMNHMKVKLVLQSSDMKTFTCTQVTML